MKHKLLFIAFLACLVACTNDPYTSGDSDLSYMRADMAMAYTDATGLMATATTDDGDSLRFSPPMKVSWATTPDSTYRALLYYNRPSPETTQLITAVRVLVLHPRKPAAGVSLPTDPLTLESGWIGADGRYLNLRLAVKTGQQNADATTGSQTGEANTGSKVGEAKAQTIGIVETSPHHWLLVHSQNGQPEYYSQTVYVSIPLTSVSPNDTLRLTVPTYDGFKQYEW